MNNGMSNRQQWENSEISFAIPIAFMRIIKQQKMEYYSL